MYCIITLLLSISLVDVLCNHKFDSFVKEKTYLLKAFLPYMIFIHHSHLFDRDFYNVGAFVVALFFFMSGYGLETKRGVGGAEIVSTSFVTNALRKLILPLLFPIIAFLFLKWLYGTPFRVILDEYIIKYQLILPYTWFVVTLIILYVLFYCCVVITAKWNNSDVSYLILIILVVLCCSILGKLIGVPSWARNTTSAFLAGIIYKRNEQRFISKLNTHAKLTWCLLTIILIAVTIYIQGDVIDHDNGPLSRPISAFIWPLFIIPLYAIIPQTNNRVIKYLSSISYELYICQSVAFILLGDKHLYHPLIYITIAFALCTLIASISHYVTQYFFR